MISKVPILHTCIIALAHNEHPASALEAHWGESPAVQDPYGIHEENPDMEYLLINVNTT